jgi:glycosyltransferase involved in cell wall biosynthesis
MEPIITFIIPVYDGRRYLREAIESVVTQTATNWRLILIDDCSKDDSREIIGQYADSRITAVYNVANRGLYGSLAEATGQVRTEWISILMQDDRLKPYFLAEVCQIIKCHQSIHALWATEDVIDQTGSLVVKGRNTLRLEYIEPSVSAWIGALRRGCVWTISGSVTRRDFLESIPFRTDLPHCGDYEWLLRGIRSRPFLYYERALLEIRQHAGQASATNLSLGVDIEERYVILSDQMSRYADDVPRRIGVEVCVMQAMMVTRRALGSALRSRLRIAQKEVRYAVCFLWLAISYKSKGTRKLTVPNQTSGLL